MSLYYNGAKKKLVRNNSARSVKKYKSSSTTGGVTAPDDGYAFVDFQNTTDIDNVYARFIGSDGCYYKMTDMCNSYWDLKANDYTLNEPLLSTLQSTWLYDSDFNMFKLSVISYSDTVTISRDGIAAKYLNGIIPILGGEPTIAFPYFISESLSDADIERLLNMTCAELKTTPAAELATFEMGGWTGNGNIITDRPSATRYLPLFMTGIPDDAFMSFEEYSETYGSDKTFGDFRTYMAKQEINNDIEYYLQNYAKFWYYASDGTILFYSPTNAGLTGYNITYSPSAAMIYADPLDFGQQSFELEVKYTGITEIPTFEGLDREIAIVDGEFTIQTPSFSALPGAIYIEDVDPVVAVVYFSADIGKLKRLSAVLANVMFDYVSGGTFQKL